MSDVMMARSGPAKPGGVWGHVLVSVSACLLTVSILGSAVILAYKGYRRYEVNQKVRSFIASLENRTPQELEERIEELKRRPKVAERVLPELRRALRSARSEGQLAATIQVCRAFIDDASIEEALFELRTDPREGASAAAVAVLADVTPAERACAMLGQCLEDAGRSGPEAVVDEAVRGLFVLGGPGLEEMKRRLAQLSVERRAWIAGYVDAVGGPFRRAWLEMLAADEDAGVRVAAVRRLASANQAQAGGQE